MSSVLRHSRVSLLAVFVTLGMFLALGATGCKDKGGGGSKKSSSSRVTPTGPEEPEMRDGLDSDWRLEHSECKKARKIESPDPGSAEETLRLMFAVASGPDSEEAFQKFYGFLHPERYAEDFARRQFWGRIREHVAKYVESPDDPTYIICREQTKSGRDDYIKYYVFSKVKSKSHTPYALVRVGESWLIEFFTP